jgi:hypothetical protein
MTIGEVAKFQRAKSRLLELSREVPTRACSPYGHQGTDYEEVRRIARAGYEAISKLLSLVSIGEKKAS